jgi:hypothetical protein
MASNLLRGNVQSLVQVALHAMESALSMECAEKT